MRQARHVTHFRVNGSGFPMLASQEDQSEVREERVLYKFGDLRLTNMRVIIGPSGYLVPSIRGVQSTVAKKWSVRFLIGIVLILLGIGSLLVSYNAYANNRGDVEKWSGNPAGPLYLEAVSEKNDWSPWAAIGGFVLVVGAVVSMIARRPRYPVYLAGFTTDTGEYTLLHFADEDPCRIFDVTLTKLLIDTSSRS
jgi:hypothetical protein